MYDSSSSDAASSFLGGLFACYALFLLVAVVVSIFIFYKILQKTGNSGWLALLVLVPFGGFGLMLFIAFSDWPVLRENRDLRSRMGYAAQPAYPTQGYAPPAQPYAPPVAPTYGAPPMAPPAQPYAPPPQGQPTNPQVPPGPPPTQP